MPLLIAGLIGLGVGTAGTVAVSDKFENIAKLALAGTVVFAAIKFGPAILKALK